MAIATMGPAYSGTAAAAQPAVGPTGWRKCRRHPSQWHKPRGQLAESVRPATPGPSVQTPAQHVLVHTPDGAGAGSLELQNSMLYVITVTSESGPE